MEALNEIKLELGLAIALCITVGLVLAVLPLARWLELLLLTVFTLAAAAWIMLRTRRLLRRLAVTAGRGGGNGAP